MLYLVSHCGGFLQNRSHVEDPCGIIPMAYAMSFAIPHFLSFPRFLISSITSPGLASSSSAF